MDLMEPIALLVGGFVCLYYGAEFLVNGSTRIAESVGIRKVIIGLTLVAFGTSAPELVVTGLSSAQGKGGNGLANVVGSNIANIGLILGLTCLVRPLPIDRKILRWEVPLMIFSSVLLWGLAEDGMISRVDGVLLLALFSLFIYSCMIHAKDVGSTQILRRLSKGKKAWNVLLILLGIAFLWAGGELLINGAVDIAEIYQVPKPVIFLTLVAIGTSLPELIVSLMATFKNSSDISVGNIIGSNLFNILLVLGVAALIRPIPVEPIAKTFQIPIMVSFAVITFPLMRRNFSLGAIEGVFILLAYVASMVGVLLLR